MFGEVALPTRLHQLAGWNSLFELRAAANWPRRQRSRTLGSVHRLAGYGVSTLFPFSFPPVFLEGLEGRVVPAVVYAEGRHVNGGAG